MYNRRSMSALRSRWSSRTSPRRKSKARSNSSPDGLREAANELVEAPPEPVAITLNDSQTGEPRPANETLSAEEAGRELARYRNWIADAKEAQSDAATAELIDHIQDNAQNPDLQPQVQQQAQPEPQQQQEPQPVQAPDGLDQEIVEALERSPKLREAIQTEIESVAVAKQTYEQGLQANARASAAALFASYPEMVGLTQEQLPGAIKAIAHQNPQRAAAIVDHIQRTSAIVAEWQRAEVANNEQATKHYQKQFAEYAKAEDSKADKLLSGVDSKKLGEAAVSTLRNIGFSDQDVRRAYNGEATIHLRDHRVQVLLAKAALYDQAQAGLHSAARAPAPPVMRPGISGERASEYD